MLSLQITSKKYNFSGEFTGRVSIILGDSGNGKTRLVARISSPGNETELKITKVSSNGCQVQKSVIPQIYTTGSFYRALLLFTHKQANSEITASDVKQYVAHENYTDAVIIVDDDDLVHDRNFITYVRFVQGCYFILVQRSDKIKIDCAVDDIFVMNVNGCEHWLTRYYESEMNTLKAPVSVLTEGNGSDFSLFSGVFPKVLHPGMAYANGEFNDTENSTGGKKKLGKFIKDNKLNDTFVLLDSCNFGTDIQAFVKVATELCVMYDLNYQSFEYFLLTLSCFDADVVHNMIEKGITSYPTRERLYTSVLTVLLEGYGIKYTKHVNTKIVACMLKADCENCDSRHAGYVYESEKDCTLLEGYSEDKIQRFEELVKGTQFEYMSEWVQSTKTPCTEATSKTKSMNSFT